MIVDTEWVVITGAPSSGKTTLINHISKQGYAVLKDPGREILRRLSEPHSAVTELQRQKGIVTYMATAYADTNPDELVFLEYGMPDNLVFQDIAGLRIPETMSLVEKYRFRKVFVLSPLAFELDGIRDKHAELQEEIYSRIISKYESVGYMPILLPRAETESLAQVILHTLESTK